QPSVNVEGLAITGSVSTQRRSAPVPSSRLKKQRRRPVWHAIPATDSTVRSTASASQSRRSSSTRSTCPEVSPFFHRTLRERDQYTASPVLAVLASASRFIHASISTSPP